MGDVFSGVSLCDSLHICFFWHFLYLVVKVSLLYLFIWFSSLSLDLCINSHY